MGENRPRFNDATSGHVESWFWRANHPDERRALWLKATVLRTPDGPDLAEAWCMLFDSERAWGGKLSCPLDEASFQTELFSARIGSCRFEQGREGTTLEGSLQTTEGPVSWSLRTTPDARALGQSLCLFPSRKMLDGRFPRNKSITPFAVQSFSGHVELGAGRWELPEAQRGAW